MPDGHKRISVRKGHAIAGDTTNSSWVGVTQRLTNSKALQVTTVVQGLEHSSIAPYIRKTSIAAFCLVSNSCSHNVRAD
jgi:hypothetical protein